MKIYVEGSTVPIKLLDNQFIAEGGEGRIYAHGGRAFKIYFNKSDVIPKEKVDELSTLKRKNIVRPLGLVYSNNKPSGYIMPYVDKTIPLPRIITTGFQNRNGIMPEMTLKLVEQIMETTQFIHDNGILVVDGNELNYLIDEKDFITPYFIDVDSYQTPTFPAKVIMPSIRDWHSNKFTILTDWYSFAIISVEIILGIHPFKGTHSSFVKGDLEGRMKSNVSIFNKDVSVPKATRNFDLVPDEMMKWYIDVFEKGNRTLPPAVLGKIIVKPQIVVVSGMNKFNIKEIDSFEEKITGCTFWNGSRIVYTNNNIIIGRIKHPVRSNKEGAIFVDGEKFSIDIKGTDLLLKNLRTNDEIKTGFIATKFMIIDNKIFIYDGRSLMQIKVSKISDKYFTNAVNTWEVMSKNTAFFRNMFVANLLGKKHIYIPDGDKSCHIVKVDELNDCEVLDAKYENGLAILLVYKNGKYDIIIIRFSEDFSGYSCEIEDDVVPYNINFTCMNSGVFVLLMGDDKVIISTKKNTDRKEIINAGLDSNLSLFNDGNQVYFHLGEKIYKFSMR